MKPALLVAVKGWDSEGWSRRFKTLMPDRQIPTADRSGLYAGPAADLDAVHYVLAWKPVQETIDRLPALRVIFSLGAGVDNIFTLDRLPDVPIVRVVHADLTARMAEYVVWQALHHLRRGAAYRRQQTERQWRDLEQPSADQLTVGIMGMGVMGQAAAKALLVLGFKVRGWGRTPRAIPGVESFSGESGLDRFLAGTDILVSLLPLTPETRGIIDLPLLRKLRRDNPLGGAFVINGGRGGSQVDADIVAALREGAIAGASLDVFEPEPLLPESPLWAFDSVVITPHVAAVSDPQSIAGYIVAQVEAYERGEELTNCVDPRRGY